MVSLVLALLAASPRPASGADLSVYVPRLDKLEGLVAFGAHAGERSVMLRPSTWSTEWHPLLVVDLDRPASLAAAGIDPAGDATISFVGEGMLTCTQLEDAKRFTTRADDRLGVDGERKSQRTGGATLVTASVEKRVIAGYALKGNVACAFRDPTDAGALSKDAVARVARWTRSAEWEAALALGGPLAMVSRRMVGAARGTADALTVDSRGSRLPVPSLRAGGTSLYAAMAPSGLLFARATVDAPSIPSLLEWTRWQIARVCPSCDGKVLATATQSLAPYLTGAVVLRVDRVKVTDSLRMPSGRYFAARHAFAAEVRSADEVRKLLSAALALRGARATEDGVALSVPGGEILAGVHGTSLYVANDAEAAKTLLSAIPSAPARAAHAAEVTLDPKLAARALSQISVFDIMSSAELAGLFAASTELGPLLGITRSVSAWADPAADGDRFSATWALTPAPSPDTGAR